MLLLLKARWYLMEKVAQSVLDILSLSSCRMSGERLSVELNKLGEISYIDNGCSYKSLCIHLERGVKQWFLLFLPYPCHPWTMWRHNLISTNSSLWQSIQTGVTCPLPPGPHQNFWKNVSIVWNIQWMILLFILTWSPQLHPHTYMLSVRKEQRPVSWNT